MRKQKLDLSDYPIFVHTRSAPASPTHGLQFTAPASIPRVTSPTKGASQPGNPQPPAPAATAPTTHKPTPLSAPIPATSFPAPSQQNTSTQAKATLQPASVHVISAAFPVSVIKSSGDTAKSADTSDSEKNGLSQSSGDESPQDLPQGDAMPVSDGRAVGAPYLKHPWAVSTGESSLFKTRRS